MRKNLFMFLMALLPMAALAEAGSGKRLLSIAIEGDGKQQQGEMSYDAEGRISRFVASGTDINAVYNYSYEGDKISMTIEGDKDVYNFTIGNGRVEKAYAYLSVDNWEENKTYQYDGDGRLVRIENKMVDQEESYSITESTELTWNGANPSSWITYRQSGSATPKEDVNVLLTYNDMAAEPLARALFGFGQGTTLWLDDIAEPLALYPYLGTLPQNLYSLASYTDMYENGKRYDYSYSYETDAKGDIVKVTLKRGNSTIVYTLTWDETDTAVSELTTTSNQSHDVFNINGRMIRPAAVSLDGLPHGVYVVGGRKVVK